MTARNAAILFGIVFLAVGGLGFVDNPIVGEHGMFMTNQLHNIIHLVSGLVLLLGAFSGLGSSNALKLVGVIYGVVAICGFFLVKDGMMMGVAINDYDKYLHVGLALVILLAGFGLSDNKSSA